MSEIPIGLVLDDSEIQLLDELTYEAMAEHLKLFVRLTDDERSDMEPDVISYMQIAGSLRQKLQALRGY